MELELPETPGPVSGLQGLGAQPAAPLSQLLSPRECPGGAAQQELCCYHSTGEITEPQANSPRPAAGR